MKFGLNKALILFFFFGLMGITLLFAEDPFADMFEDSPAEGKENSDESTDFDLDLFADEPDTSDSTDSKEDAEGTAEEVLDGQESAESIESDITEGDDLDSLFDSDEELVSELDQSNQEEDPTGALQQSDKLEWGGKFRTELDFRFQWDDSTVDPGRLHDRTFVDPFVEAYLFFDARPKKNYRIFGKFVTKTSSNTTLSQLESTFGFNPEDAQVVNNNDGTFSVGFEEEDDSIKNEYNRIEPSATTLTFGVQEIFADFNWQDQLYFRIGKSFVKWGVGYFFSPADVINPEMIDFEDPSEDRSGPLFFRMHYPFKEHNLYTYLIAEAVEEIDDVAFALNMEFLVKNVEMSAGAYYKIKHSPKFTFTISAPVNDFKLFAEAVLSIGSDRVYVRPSRNLAETETDDDGNETLPYNTLDTYTMGWKPVFSGTAGLLYMNQEYGLTFIGQYYFNGEGYKKFRFEDGSSLLDAAAYLFQNPNSNGLYKGPDARPNGYIEPANLELDDMLFWGQHYIALSFMANDIEKSGVSLLSYWIGAMSDLSGIYSFELSYKIIDYIDIAGGFRISYGESGSEFSDPMALYLQSDSNLQEPTTDFYLLFRIGGGNF